jgi:hypothetical protein
MNQQPVEITDATIGEQPLAAVLQSGLLPDDTPVRYIKLGPGGSWARRCIAEGRIEFAPTPIDASLIEKRDWDVWRDYFVAAGSPKGVAAHSANQWMSFSTLPAHGIWITFEDDHLYWAFADPVIETDGDGSDATRGCYARRAVGGWRRTSLTGVPLRKSSLSTVLTSIAGYQRTICEVRASRYLLRKLNGVEEPAVLEAMQARAAVIAAADKLIGSLHQDDFETMVDLILNRSGWHRVSALGGIQKDADMIVEQAVTGETAFVQVKSQASQSVLESYIRIFDGYLSGGQGEAAPPLAQPLDAKLGAVAAPVVAPLVEGAVGPQQTTRLYDRMIFACHQSNGTLTVHSRPDILLWDRQRLSQAVIRNGLLDWLIQRAG